MDRAKLQPFFDDVNYRVQLTKRLRCQLDERLATRFNVLDLIEPDENKLSDVLAGLLNPKGAYGQGDPFLRLLFDRLNLRPDAELTKDATVQREAPMRGTRKDHRRMDLFVNAGLLLAMQTGVCERECAIKAENTNNAPQVPQSQ